MGLLMNKLCQPSHSRELRVNNIADQFVHTSHSKRIQFDSVDSYSSRLCNIALLG